MKAGVIHEFGSAPRYEDFPDPKPDPDGILVRVKATALENFDRMTAKGTHYSSRETYPGFPAIVGHAGVGTLADGSLVMFGGVSPPYGTMAEMVMVPQKYKMYVSPVPSGVDPAVAAAAPSSILTSLLSLKFGAKLQPGETVLVNGATGFAGKLAVQIAKMLGARRVTGAGRDEESLRRLPELGADAVIDLKKPDGRISGDFEQDAGDGYDVVVDFLWGRPTELLLKTFVPKEAGFPTHRTRFVQIGEAAGPVISLAAETLRTSGLEVSGAGAISPSVIPEALNQGWEWIKESKLQIDVEKVPLKDIAEAWNRDAHGKRIVIVP